MQVHAVMQLTALIAAWFREPRSNYANQRRTDVIEKSVPVHVYRLRVNNVYAEIIIIIRGVYKDSMTRTNDLSSRTEIKDFRPCWHKTLGCWQKVVIIHKQSFSLWETTYEVTKKYTVVGWYRRGQKTLQNMTSKWMQKLDFSQT